MFTSPYKSPNICLQTSKQNSFCLDPYPLTYYFLREASEKQLLFQIRMNASPHSLNPLAPSPHRTIFLEFFTDV